jgi:hypothetical protein
LITGFLDILKRKWKVLISYIMEKSFDSWMAEVRMNFSEREFRSEGSTDS